MVVKMQGKGHRYQKGRHTSHVSTTHMVRARTEFVVLNNFLVAAPTKKKKHVWGTLILIQVSILRKMDHSHNFVTAVKVLYSEDPSLFPCLSAMANMKCCFTYLWKKKNHKR